MAQGAQQRRRTGALLAVAVVAALGMLGAGAGAGAGTPSFSDVGPTHPFRDEIHDVAERDVMTGYGDGTFRPANQVTRQAVAAVLYREAGSPETSPPASADRSFVDVKPAHPFYAEIEWAAAEGLVRGWDTDYVDPETGYLPEFRPSSAVTRQAVAAMLHRFAGSPPHAVSDLPRFNDVLGGIAGPEHPFRVPIEWARAEELMFGWGAVAPGQQCVDYGCDGWFRPAGLITRQALAAVLSRVHQQAPPA
jgi:hypothetical protein